MGRHQSDPRGSELDRERESVEERHERLHGGRVGRVLPVGRPGTGVEQRLGVGRDERRERQCRLAGKPQDLAGRHEERGVFGVVEPHTRGFRGVPGDLLEVVQDHEAAAAAGDRFSELNDGIILAELHVEGGRDGVGDAVHRTCLGDVAEPHPPRPRAEPGPPVMEREAGLARPSHAEQGHEPRSVVDAGGQLLEVVATTDERVALGREVTFDLADGNPRVVVPTDPPRLGGVGRRGEGGFSADADLEQLDRIDDTLELPVPV